MTSEWAWVLATGGAVLLLAMIYRRDKLRRLVTRAKLLDLVAPLLEEPRFERDLSGFPRLLGRYKGQAVKIELLLESLAVRKLPALWIIVTLYGKTTSQATLDILVRPGGHEIFSPSQRLPIALSRPEGWPDQAAIRADRTEGLPDLKLLTPHLDFFQDPQAKELAVTPKGVRLVYLAREGQRAHYLVLRDAELGDFQVPASLATALLARSFSLWQTLEDKSRP